jgi:hypothetical protein
MNQVVLRRSATKCVRAAWFLPNRPDKKRKIICITKTAFVREVMQKIFF